MVETYFKIVKQFILLKMAKKDFFSWKFIYFYLRITKNYSQKNHSLNLCHVILDFEMKVYYTFEIVVS